MEDKAKMELLIAQLRSYQHDLTRFSIVAITSEATNKARSEMRKNTEENIRRTEKLLLAMIG